MRGALVATPDRTINDLVNDALLRWVAVTGTDPERKTFRWSNGTWGDYDLSRVLEDLNQSRELDPSGITTFMLLRGVAEAYLRDTHIAALDFLLDPASVEAKIAPLRDLRAVLEDERVVAGVRAFEAWVRDASEHYGVAADGRKEIDAILGDKRRLAYLRRDALRSIETLEAHQFVQGTPEPEGIKYNPEVYEFWNIQSLLRAMQAQPESGITMCLVRDPANAMFSFFCIAVRSGECLTVLTDRERVPHPDMKRATRRADRILGDRAERHWFPYQLLDLKVTADQTRLYVAPTTALVPINTEAVKIARVAELPADQFVWWILLLDLVRERYGNRILPETSYTGEMVATPHALVGPGADLVVSGRYVPLAAEPLTAACVTAEATASQWAYPTTGDHRWLMERYASSVPDAALNPVGEAEGRLLSARVAEETGLANLESFYIDGRSLRRTTVADMRSMDPVAFGTREEIERDRLWVARMNQAKVVSALALREFDETRGAVVGWFRHAVETASERLLQAAAKGSLLLPSCRREIADHFSHKVEVSEREALSQLYGKTPHRHDGSFDGPYAIESTRKPGVYAGQAWGSDGLSGEVALIGGRDPRAAVWYCADDPDTKANVFTTIRPDCAEALAALCGVTIGDLPWQVQHWRVERRYIGNSILSRIDPEDSVLDDPWRSLHFGAFIALSRRAIDVRRRAMGLPKKVWDTRTHGA